MKSYYDEIYEILKHVAEESAGQLSVLNYAPESRPLGAKIDLLAHVRIGGQSGYNAYLVLEEKTRPFVNQQDLDAITMELEVCQRDLREKSEKDGNDLQIFGVIVAKGFLAGTRKQLRTKRIPYIDMTTNEVFLPLPNFFFSESGAQVLDGDSSLTELLQGKRRNTKTNDVLLALLKGGTDRVWTIKQLSEKAKLAASAVHKLKHRLLRLGIVVPSNDTAGMTRFHLSEDGKKAIEELNLRK